MNPLPTILVVDDSSDDIALLLRAFAQEGLGNPVDACESGQEALDYVSDPRHDTLGLIILDVKMPGLNGFDVLGRLKANPALQNVPVVMFTSSALPDDINRSFTMGTDGFMNKPLTFGELRNLIGSFRTRWPAIFAADDTAHPPSDGASPFSRGTSIKGSFSVN